MVFVMIRQLLCFVSTLTLCSSAPSADFRWEEYLAGMVINDIVFEGNIIWCATEDHGAVWFDSVTGDFGGIAASDTLKAYPLWSCCLDSSGVKWFGGEKILYSYKDEIGAVYRFLYVNDVECDMNNVIWAKSYDCVHALIDNQWKYMDSQYEHTIAIDSYNRVWVGTGNGIGVYDDGEWSYIENDVENVEIAFDSRDEPWIITYHEGLLTRSNGNWTKLEFDWPEYQIFGGNAIVIDRNDVVWMGTGEGLFSYSDGRLERWWYDDEFHQVTSSERWRHKIIPEINDLETGPDGSVWAATENGLVRYIFPPVSVEEETRPEPFRDLHAWPNPFNAAVTVEFSLDTAETVGVDVYDCLGRKVKRLAAGRMTAGAHTLVWDGTGDDGRGVSSGLYFVRVSAGRRAAVKKVTLVR